MTYEQQLDMVIKLLVAAVLGGLVGLERERDKRPAGLRTYILICLGATIFGLIGKYTFPNDSAGLSRMWQNIITGVGFLGAGAVIKDERGVQGLTTAAGIWAVAGIGLAVAADLYMLAGFAEVILLVTLLVLRRVEHHFYPLPPNDEPR